MKKLLLVMAFVLMASSCFALTVGGDSDTWQTYIVDNTSGLSLTTFVSTTGTAINSFINPKIHKILGFEVFPIDTNSENWVALYDCANLDLLNNENFFGEVECQPSSWDGMWFPRPKYLTTGLAIRQGGHTRAIVYYTAR